MNLPLCFHTIFAYYSPMGERGSTVRMRLNGQLCCSCKKLLPTPPTPGERYCDRCKPLSAVYVSYERIKGWQIIVYDSATQERICSLVFQDEEKIREFARRGGALTNLGSRQGIEHGIEYGKGGFFLRLSSEQYVKLQGR